MSEVSAEKLRASASVAKAVGEFMGLLGPLCLAVIVTVLAKPPALIQWAFGIVVAILLPIWIGVRIAELVIARKELARREKPPA